MSLTAKSTATVKRDPITAGVKTAVCCGIVDLCEQESVWEGKVKSADKVMFIWELPKEVIETEDGPRPRTISKQYTNSLHEKAGLRKLLQNWRGIPFPAGNDVEFDLLEMLGKGCLISIIHAAGKDGETYARVGDVIGLPEGMDAPKATHLFSLNLDDPDALDTLELLPGWVQDRVKAGKTYPILLARRERPDWAPEDVPMDSEEDAVF